MKRQCGYRKKGGAYLTVPTSEDGVPVEYFLVDPPQRLIWMRWVSCHAECT
jgi:hypothetical protein